MSAAGGRIGVMTATAHDPRSSRDATLLDAVRAPREREIAEQVQQLELIVDWCSDHQVDEADAATIVEFGHDTGLPLTGRVRRSCRSSRWSSSPPHWG